MEEIKIYDPSGTLLLSTFVDDKSYRLCEIMGANDLHLSFSLDRYVEIIEGSYCDFMTERYWLPQSTVFEKQHTEHYNYTLQLEGAIGFLKSTKFKFFDYIIQPDGSIKATSSFRLKFPLTATPRMVAQLIVANLKLKYPQYPWAVGECIEAEPVTLDFNHSFCFDVLTKTSDAHNTEWELDKFTLHFRKVERIDNKGDKINFSLSYGYDNGILGGLKRVRYDNTRIINRVYIEGGDRNIDRKTYGRDRDPSGSDLLLLPANRRITYEGVEYTTDASGSYLERVEPLAGDEDSLDISRHYPKRVGTITAVEKINDSKGLYNIIDLDIPESLDYSKMIIAGEQMTLIPQTGQLAGMEFDVNYIHSKRKFELVPIERNGLIYPQGNIVPAVGDTYAVFHMRMPNEYIEAAENDALQDVAEYLFKNEQPQYSYRWTLDGIYANRNWGEIRGYLNIGFFVEFSDPQFLPEPVNVRIVAVREPVNDPKSPEITIANNVSGATLPAVLNEIPRLEQTVERKDNEVVSFARRGFRQSRETLDKLNEALLDYEAGIRPSTIETMMGLFGNESLQFRYVDNQTNPTVKPSGITYDKGNKRIVCPAGMIQHMTLGIKSISSSHAVSEYQFWQTKAYQSDVLTDARANYFLYLKASQTDHSDAVYILSEKAIKMDALNGYYHFLVGILNSEDYDANRSFVELFGLTEIFPGRITADRFISADGQSFFDFVANVFTIGNDTTRLDWNVVKDSLRLLNVSLIIQKNIDGKEVTVAAINNEDGSAIFGKGAIKFDADGSASFGHDVNRFNADGSGWVGNVGELGKLIQWSANTAKVGSFDFFTGFLRYFSKKIGIYIGEDIFPATAATDGVMRLEYKASSVDVRRSVLYIDSEGEQIGTWGELNNRAIHIANGALRVNPGNIIDMPGLLFAGRVNGDGSRAYQWGLRARRGLPDNAAFLSSKDNKNIYRITHKLGHTNYSVNVTLMGSDYRLARSSGLIRSLENDSFEVVMPYEMDGFQSNYAASFLFSVFGENTQL